MDCPGFLQLNPTCLVMKQPILYQHLVLIYFLSPTQAWKQYDNAQHWGAVLPGDKGQGSSGKGFVQNQHHILCSVNEAHLVMFTNAGCCRAFGDEENW